MKIKTFVVGPMQTNCYVLSDEETGEAIIIDPGDEPEKIKKYLVQNKLKPEFIVNTHGHVDHIASDAEFKLPVYIHKLDLYNLRDPLKNLSSLVGGNVKPPSQIMPLEDKDIIGTKKIKLEVIHTPGHTPGGISLKFDNMVFTGDTLFCSGIGRTDFPGASEARLIESIKNRLFVLADDTVIYPGHGPSSTIGQEKESNSFV
jgi:glyoxylase-like metal-dependent hydrolase (beta-lactamase superfamily II)